MGTELQGTAADYHIVQYRQTGVTTWEAQSGLTYLYLGGYWDDDEQEEDCYAYRGWLEFDTSLIGTGYRFDGVSLKYYVNTFAAVSGYTVVGSFLWRVGTSEDAFALNGPVSLFDWNGTTGFADVATHTWIDYGTYFAVSVAGSHLNTGGHTYFRAARFGDTTSGLCGRWQIYSASNRGNRPYLVGTLVKLLDPSAWDKDPNQPHAAATIIAAQAQPQVVEIPATRVIEPGLGRAAAARHTIPAVSTSPPIPRLR